MRRCDFIVLFVFLFSFSFCLLGCDKKSVIESYGDISMKDDDMSGSIDYSYDSSVGVCDVLVSSESMLQKSAYVVDAVVEDENVMYSPLSLNLALGLLTNGMNDECKKFMMSYLGEDIDSYNGFVESYMKSLPSTVEIANGLFVDKHYSFNENVVSVLKKSYDVECASLDFSTVDSVNYVNDWCNNATNGFITEIVSDLYGYSFVATNALYFKDTWDSKIEDDCVNEYGEFINLQGDVQICNMMSMSENCYLENDNAIGFIKPYSNYKYGFVAMLPKVEGEFSMSDLDIESLLASANYNANVKVFMPEFSFDNTLVLNDVFAKLGLSNLFEKSYCGNLLNDEVAFVDMLLQKTKVDVNRDGTEASAVTAIMMTNSAFVDSKDYVVNINRPFAFMIYDFEENIPLFMGKVVSMD